MKKYITPVLSLFLITIVVVGLLALTSNITKDIIAQREQEALQEAMSVVLPGGAPFTDITESIAKTADSINAGLVSASQSAKGYVFVMNTSGYGGEMNVLVGIDENGGIANILLGEHSETPNIGTKAELPEFTSQFVGVTPQDTLRDKVDNITGATKTVDGIFIAVDNALALYSEVVK